MLEEMNQFTNSGRHQIESADGSQIIHIALIDYLQEWNFKKKTERLAKVIIKGYDKDMLSAVPANPYFLRFNRFLDEHIFGIPKVNQIMP